MVLTHTPAGELGSELKAFSLPSIKDSTVCASSFKNDILWVMFICNHCPYVKAIEKRIASLASWALDNSIDVVAICSNQVSLEPEDSKKHLLEQSHRVQFKFDYLIDSNLKVAQDFGAVATPDFFVYKSKRLVYRGRLDDNWKDEQNVKEESLKIVFSKLLKNESLEGFKEVPSMGCSIKNSNLR